MKAILNQLYRGENLEQSIAKELLLGITNLKYNDQQVAAFLSVYNMRMPTSDELLGFRDAMLEQAIRITFPYEHIVDIVGTGGDGKDTFNISTLACFICAGAGIKVAKHGNYAVSSVSGSSNVLENLGVTFAQHQDKLAEQLERANITFLHAPFFHPAMKNVAAIRKALSVRTLFNLLGPISNPANTTIQIIGVYNQEIGKLYQTVLQRTANAFIVVHSLDGYDEISLTGDTLFYDRQSIYELSPNQQGFQTLLPEQIYGGTTAKESAELFLSILQGNGTNAQNDVVLANAALAIMLYKNVDRATAIALAKDSLLGGKALSCLQQLIATN